MIEKMEERPTSLHGSYMPRESSEASVGSDTSSTNGSNYALHSRSRGFSTAWPPNGNLRQSSNRGRYRKSHMGSSNTHMRDPRVSRMEGKVQLHGLPEGTRPYDIYLALESYGNIIRIECGKTAYVVFRPPPLQTLFNDRVMIKGGFITIHIKLCQEFFIKSPINLRRHYYETFVFRGNALDFGVTSAPEVMDIMKEVVWPGRVQMTLSLGDWKRLDFQFPMVLDGQLRRFRFELPLSLLKQVYLVHDGQSNQLSLIIPFNSPPKFYKQAIGEDLEKTFNPREKNWVESYSWMRQTDVSCDEVREKLKVMPVMNHKGDAIIDIGRWTTYRIRLDSSASRSDGFDQFCHALSDHGVRLIKNSRMYLVKKGRSPPIWDLLEEEICGTHPHFEIVQETTSRDFMTSKFVLPFPVQYQLEACLTNGYLKEHAMTFEFLAKLAVLAITHLEEAIHILEKVTDRQIIHLDPMTIFTIKRKAQPKTRLPSHCILSRAVNITPTTMHVAPPVVETSNRILRKHVADADRFIRVRFSDEKSEGQIYSQADNRMDAIFDKVKRAMRNGIVVAGRYYEFLAFGNSQFREHGAYFYAPTSSKTADDIRRAMGTFDHIKTASKYGARLGQCFSTTRAIRNTNVLIKTIPDIERNGYTFTDGVGRISLFLAKMASEELGLDNSFTDPPSLYQFRLAGCKGVLAVDPTITGNTIHIRPSQYKFEAINVGLEIIRTSKLTTACFNRQLIIILSNLGVDNLVFLRKQQEMVHYLEEATTNEDVALDRLRRNVDLNQISLIMAIMIQDGFMGIQEPFIMSLLKLWRAYNIKYLKEKARILIEEGAFVFGCVDETATLKGHFDSTQFRLDATRAEKLATLPEIFLRVSDPLKRGHYRVVEGICVLARNPSLHAGDVRIVRAVNVPALHHLKNVVVFPQTGDRDIANMCSGGDLDGDEFIVIWDPRFTPRDVNMIPMDFTPEKPTESTTPINIHNIADFFVDYIRYNSLARIAVAHLAQADFNEDGVRSEACLELARLHSQAVDYPKSGIPASMDRSLAPARYPHFLNNNRPAHKIYKSEKILGMLFEQVELVDFEPRYTDTFDERILNAFQLDEGMLKKAQDLKAAYDFDLGRLMAQHAIKTEFEAWSIFVMSHNLEVRDYTFAEKFSRTVDILKSDYRTKCLAAAGIQKSAYGDLTKLGPFVAAMYTVTAQQTKASLQVASTDADHSPMPLISFPWLFYNELGRIRNKRPGRLDNSKI